MANESRESLIFGRYTREECGLPPAGQPFWRAGGLTGGRLLGLLAATALLGWLAGMGSARWREAWLAALPARVAAAATAQEASDLMTRGRMYATALPGNRIMRRDLALAALTAAENAPRRLGYCANAANLFRGIDPEGVPDREVFATGIAEAGAYGEIGDYPAAFRALDRAGAGLEHIADEQRRRSLRLLLVNTQAYFLAIAPAGQGGDAEKALRLARLMVASRDALPGGGHASGSAAFLDTLAAAWNANGDSGRAASAQSLALGLADARGLDVYLRHYDEFSDQ
ncbi:MAG: hypothetical protein LBS30_02475 [Planctomycetota bacterium]|jgi:hypothetical protein|nr:hypothetical protein [Planctomycetota bacterium]